MQAMVLFGQIDAAGWAIIAGAIIAAIGKVYLDLRSAREVASKVDKVRTTLVRTDKRKRKKLDELKNVTDDTHTLVNSNMGVQLEINRTLARRVAELTKDPEDIRVADLAEKLYYEHVGKQDNVDNKGQST